MTDLNKLRRLAGVPVDLSKVDNARTTVTTPKRLPFANILTEAGKVPQHRGEISPKTKKNMRGRVSCAKKALEMLELARDELMSLPAVDYDESIPDVIRQLHKMLHGEDGTGGLHGSHRQYEREYNDMEFPEDLENTEPGKDGNPTEEEVKAKEKESAKKKAENEKKKSVKEGEELGFEKQKVDPSKENKKPFKLAPGSDEDTMYTDGEENVEKDPVERTPKPDDVQESMFGLSLGSKAPSRKPRLGGGSSDDTVKPEAVKAAQEAGIKKPKSANPFGGKVKSEEEENVESEEEEKSEKKPAFLKKAEIKAEEKEEGKKVTEAQGPLFARDAVHPNHDGRSVYPSWNAGGNKPTNVVASDDGVSLYYPNGSKSENASQLSTNPYNESQKVTVPAKIKSALKGEADVARKLAETFTMRKDWDNKNFHENLANAFDTLNGFLDKGTIYGIKEAQVFMTSLMSPMMNKIPADVIKYIAAGGTLRSLKSYVNDVKEPVTGTVFQQDSNGTK